MDLASRLESPETKAIVTWNNNIAWSSSNSGACGARSRVTTCCKSLSICSRPTPPTPMPTTRPGGELPRIRRRGHVLLQQQHLGASEGSAATRRGAAQPRDLQTSGGGHGIDQSGTVRDGRRVTTATTSSTRQSPVSATLRGTLAEAGTIEYPAQPVVQFEHHDYRTSSGKIELTGTTFIECSVPALSALRLSRGAARWRRAAPALPGVDGS